MRSRLNGALVGVAGALALVLTVVRQSPEGVVSLDLHMKEVRAAPGEARVQRHDLTALAIFNQTLVRIKDRYVDPTRVDPKKMLFAALDSFFVDFFNHSVAAVRNFKVLVRLMVGVNAFTKALTEFLGTAGSCDFS